MRETYPFQKPCWHVLRDPTYPPETLIRLGQLIVDPRQPTDRLGKGPLELGPDDSVFNHCPEVDVTYVDSDSRSYGIGLGAAIMSMLPFGIKGHYKSSSAKLFEIERVESQSLEPSEEYVRRSLMQSAVRSYLAAKKYKKSLYMIVGLKLGRNAQIIARESKIAQTAQSQWIFQEP